jgi:predicted CopG family antitoxin
MHVIIVMRSETMTEHAKKRIPVTPETWETLHDLKKPGQTYNELIKELILQKETHDSIKSGEDLEKDTLNRLLNDEITFEDAKLELCLTDKELEVKLDGFNWMPSLERLKELTHVEMESISAIHKLIEKENKQNQNP